MEFLQFFPLSFIYSFIYLFLYLFIHLFLYFYFLAFRWINPFRMGSVQKLMRLIFYLFFRLTTLTENQLINDDLQPKFVFSRVVLNYYFTRVFFTGVWVTTKSSQIWRTLLNILADLTCVVVSGLEASSDLLVYFPNSWGLFYGHRRLLVSKSPSISTAFWSLGPVFLLSLFFPSVICWNGENPLFACKFKLDLVVWIRLVNSIVSQKEMLCDSFYRRDSGLCIFHLWA